MRIFWITILLLTLLYAPIQALEIEYTGNYKFPKIPRGYRGNWALHYNLFMDSCEVVLSDMAAGIDTLNSGSSELEGRVSVNEDAINDLEGRMDVTEDVIQDLIVGGTISVELGTVEARLGSIETRLDVLESGETLDVVKGKISSIPSDTEVSIYNYDLGDTAAVRFDIKLVNILSDGHSVATSEWYAISGKSMGNQGYISSANRVSSMTMGGDVTGMIEDISVVTEVTAGNVAHIKLLVNTGGTADPGETAVSFEITRITY